MYLKPIQKAEMYIYIYTIPIFGHVSEAYSESKNACRNMWYFKHFLYFKFILSFCLCVQFINY